MKMKMSAVLLTSALVGVPAQAMNIDPAAVALGIVVLAGGASVARAAHRQNVGERRRDEGKEQSQRDEAKRPAVRPESPVSAAEFDLKAFEAVIVRQRQELQDVVRTAKTTKATRAANAAKARLAAEKISAAGKAVLRDAINNADPETIELLVGRFVDGTKKLNKAEMQSVFQRSDTYADMLTKAAGAVAREGASGNRERKESLAASHAETSAPAPLAAAPASVAKPAGSVADKIKLFEPAPAAEVIPAAPAAAEPAPAPAEHTA